MDYSSLHPTSLPQYFLPEKIRVALVLGAGGSRGMAHVGVVEELVKAEIPIDIIVGSSAGSFVGALFADSADPEYVARVLMSSKRKHFLDMEFLKVHYGLGKGTGIRKILSENMEARRFTDLKIPLLVVATDLIAGAYVCFGGGEIIPAVHASCAMPFYFQPVKLFGRALLDGGVANPIPVDVARKHHAEIVIAVDLSELLEEDFSFNVFGVAKRSLDIAFLAQAQTCTQNADVVIKPDLRGFGTFDDGHNREKYEAGREAGRAAIPKIQEILKEAT